MITGSFISTSALTTETRLSIARLQKSLIEAQTELSTGRHADVGLKLGGKTGTAVALRQEQARIESIISSNQLVSTRLKTSQVGLDAILSGAETFLAALVRAQSNPDEVQSVVQDAKAGLEAVLGTLNSSLDGQYVFAGINSDVKPFESYFSASTPASRQAIADAFQARFGMSQDDPAVADIPAADIADFLDNQFAAEFADPSWGANWSAASDQNVRNRISRTELVTTSANAGQQPFRDLISALTMVADLGFENLNEQARQEILGKAIEKVGGATKGVINIQAELGLTQQRVTSSIDLLTLQKNLVVTSIGTLEEVDDTEVSTRLAQLLTQMETAYALTKRISDLSLINFL